MEECSPKATLCVFVAIHQINDRARKEGYFISHVDTLEISFENSIIFFDLENLSLGTDIIYTTFVVPFRLQ